MSGQSDQREDTGRPALRNPGAHLDRDWPAYFDAVEGNPPRDTLLLALDRFDAEGLPDDALALDLGAGSGRDTMVMLRRGWRVVAIDGSADGLARLRAQAEREGEIAARLETVEARFEGMDLEQLAPNGAAMVNASFALPFCPPEKFEAMWAGIREVLRRGAASSGRARFAGQFFGDRDEWAGIEGRTHLTREAVERLLDGLERERFEEIEKEGNDAFGNPKHYHIFHMVLRQDRDGARTRR